jgi:hypothetical protein
VSQGDLSVYLNHDGRLLLYDASQQEHREIRDPREDLRHVLDAEQYCTAMRALGLKPVGWGKTPTDDL